MASNQATLAEIMPLIGLTYDAGFILGRTAVDRPMRAGFPDMDWIRIEGPVLPQGAEAKKLAGLFQADAQKALRAFFYRVPSAALCVRGK